MRKIIDGWQFSKVKSTPILDVPEIANQIPLLIEESTQPIGYRLPFYKYVLQMTQNGLQFVKETTYQEILPEDDAVLLVKFGLPSDTDLYRFTGRVAILSSETEYPREFNTDKYKLEYIDDFIQADNAPSSYRDTYLDTLMIKCSAGITTYVSIFYEVFLIGVFDDPFFIFSQMNCLNSGLPNPTYLPLESNIGSKLFQSLPMYLRTEDAKNGNATKKLLNILGRSLDDINTKVNDLKYLYDIDRTNNRNIAYIDNLLGWETNFEFNESLRKSETKKVIDIYKSKSTSSAIELILQEILGWNVEIQEGYPFVFSLNQTPYELLGKPDDWNDDIDGNWNELTTNTPISTTYHTDMGAINVGSIFSPIAILPSFSDAKDNTGNNFQNLNGVLIKLYPLPNRKVELGRDIFDKLNVLLPQLLVHYADYFISVVDVFDETLPLAISDYFEDSAMRLNVEQMSLRTKSGTFAPNSSLFETWQSTYESLMNDPAYRLFHTAIGMNGSETGAYSTDE